MLDNPYIQTWLTADYAKKEAQQETAQLKNGKARGSDGAPGEAFKILQKEITEPARIIMRKIKNLDTHPKEWVGGAVVQIKGGS